MKTSLLAFVLVILSSACFAHAAEGATSFKGWELYIWKDGAEWKFSLMEGTNELKEPNQIKQAAVSGIDAIKKKLDALAGKQQVFLSGRTLQAAPPKEIARELIIYGEKRGLIVMGRC